MRFFGQPAAAAVAVVCLFAVATQAEEAVQPPAAETQTAPPTGQAPAEAAPTENPDEVICKKLPPETGTHLGRQKVCHTRREWDEMAEEAKQALEKAQTKN